MKRAKHSLSHYKLFSGYQGNLIPISCVEVLPGDSIQHSTSCLVRMQPLLAPLMHPVHVTIHHWFVPTRIIWEDFEEFITGGSDGENNSIPPTIDPPDTTGWAVGSLADYFGLPTGVDYLSGTSALPFRAYALIYNEFYRDQDLEDTLAISLASSLDTTTSTTLQNRDWEKDYFTTARPWPQKGPDVTVPLTGSLPIVSSGQTINLRATLGTGTDGAVQRDQSTNHLTALGGAGGGGYENMKFGTITGLIANLNSVGISINDLREAFATQKFEELRARYGSRYVEYLRTLGVRSSDARLQRPEYLGGGKQTLQISEVLQTAVTPGDADDLGVGNLRGHGIGAVRSNRYRRFFEEHGYVITIFSVKPKTMYMQGINRMWLRQTKEDWWQPQYEHIGQQEISEREIYATNTIPGPNFGYQDRYDEYRRIPSTVSGDFRTTLKFWHMAREFTTVPTLNEDFVRSNPTTRIYAAPAEDNLWVMAQHSIQARRLISKMGTPSGL